MGQVTIETRGRVCSCQPRRTPHTWKLITMRMAVPRSPFGDGDTFERGRIGAYRREHSVIPVGRAVLLPHRRPVPRRRASQNFRLPATSSVVPCLLAMLDHAPEAVLMVTPKARSRGFLVWLASITLVPLIGLPLALQMAQVHRMDFRRGASRSWPSPGRCTWPPPASSTSIPPSGP